jgi:hypothetical protein
VLLDAASLHLVETAEPASMLCLVEQRDLSDFMTTVHVAAESREGATWPDDLEDSSPCDLCHTEMDACETGFRTQVVEPFVEQTGSADFDAGDPDHTVVVSASLEGPFLEVIVVPERGTNELSARPSPSAIARQPEIPAYAPIAKSITAVAPRSEPANFWSGEPAAPLTWSLRSDAVRSKSSPFTMLSVRDLSTVNVTSAPADPSDRDLHFGNNLRADDPFRSNSLDTPLEEVLGGRETPIAAHSQAGAEAVQDGTTPVPDETGRDALLAAFAEETIWTAGLLPDWPFSRGAAWVLMGAATVSEILSRLRKVRSRESRVDASEMFGTC